MKIPSSSIPRISLYYRALLSVKEKSVISSQELAEITKCTATQIRKDLAYFGQFGTPGRGYPIKNLKDKLKNILGTDRNRNVALIGIGNLGSALLAYKGFKGQGFNIRYVFDNDKKKINKLKEGIKVREIGKLRTVIRNNNIDMAIVAVSQDSAEEVIDELVSSGVKAILNFAPIRPKVPDNVELLNIDLSIELEKLTFFLQQRRVR